VNKDFFSISYTFPPQLVVQDLKQSSRPLLNKKPWHCATKCSTHTYKI